jgi:RNA polymerase sigma factor (sigma-70 family)
VDYEAALRRAQGQALRILGDLASAEDVAAESVTRIVSGADPKFFGLIVNGLAIDEYRRRGKEVPADPLDADYLEPGERDQLPHVATLTFDDVEFRADFDRALRALPAEERDAIILTDRRGLTLRESSVVLATSYETVRRRAETARALIQMEVAA